MATKTNTVPRRSSAPLIGGILVLVVVAVVLGIYFTTKSSTTDESQSKSAPTTEKPSESAPTTGKPSEPAPPPEVSASWVRTNDYDYPGNDIGTCGQTNSLEELKSACLANNQCKGVSLVNNRPWCLKHTLAGGNAAPTVTFYKLNR